MSGAETQILANDEHRFPCDACGADLRFAPDQGQLVCDHCGSTQPLEGLGGPPGQIRELDYRAALRGLDDAELETTKVLSCTNCAAQVEFAPNIHAAECPFCATPVVTGTGENRHIKPKAVLPFQLEERDARKAMTDWLGRLWFAPNGLAEYARKGRQMEGIYLPYWTFDADTKTRYTGQRGDVYYVNRSVLVDGKKRITREAKIRWTPVSGRVARFFDDVLVLASRSLPKRFTDRLTPWELGDLLPYTPEVLAGFRAEAYGIALDEGMDTARTHMDSIIQRDIRFDIGGNRQRISSADTKISDVTFKHILLPVWIAAYKYRGKTYRFVVNGQTGKVDGERPYSAIKIAIAVLFGLIVAGVVGYFAAQAQ